MLSQEPSVFESEAQPSRFGDLELISSFRKKNLSCLEPIEKPCARIDLFNTLSPFYIQIDRQNATVLYKMEQSHEKLSIDIAKGNYSLQLLCSSLFMVSFLVFPSTKVFGLHTISGGQTSSSVP